jgi:lipopolysaccharide transport system ATP-binding protein
MYKLYQRSADKVLEALGLHRLLFWKKIYAQEFWALRNFDLTVYKGERLGIIGRNGAGKSTLLKIISGNVMATEGTVEVKGRIQTLMELGTGFHPDFTGRQNICASLAYQGFSPSQIRDKEEEIIDFAELEEFIDQPIKTYSAGMYARLAFSAATAVEPDILIIDEVLGAGDAYFAGKCVERMKKLTTDSGATVLFVSHDLHSVQRLCDRVIWIDRGQIRQEGNPLETIKAYSAMVRKEEEIRLKARDLKILKKQALLLNRQEDIYDKLLFHFMDAEGRAPKGIHKIYSLKLSTGQECIGDIEVGQPMDNSPEHLNYIIDTPGYMDWGSPQRDEHGTYRVYSDFKGKYQHAPFEFAVPKSYRMHEHMHAFRLEIEAEISTDGVAVDIYDSAQKHYLRLGTLVVGSKRTHSFVLPSRTSAVVKEEQIPCEGAADQDLTTFTSASSATPSVAISNKTQTEYGTGEVRITSVELVDHRGRESRVFEPGKSMKILIKFSATEKVDHPVFFFCIYLPDGVCAAQVWTTEEDWPGIVGLGSVCFDFDPLLLGPGSFVASVGVYKYLSADGTESPAYHVLDRAIHFQIVESLDEKYKYTRGLCRQPYSKHFASHE